MKELNLDSVALLASAIFFVKYFDIYRKPIWRINILFIEFDFMSSVNPAVPGATATHGHGIPETITPTTIPGTVRFEELPPLHVGDPWIEHYVPEWESAHPIVVITGALNVQCDGRPVAGTGISSVMCGAVTVSPVMTTILVP